MADNITRDGIAIESIMYYAGKIWGERNMEIKKTKLEMPEIRDSLDMYGLCELYGDGYRCLTPRFADLDQLSAYITGVYAGLNHFF